MIRTLVEIQGGRVSIRETGAETTVTVTVDGALSETDRTAEVRERSNGELRRELDRRTQERDEREQARAKLERGVDQLKTGRREDHEEIEELRRQRDSALDDLEKVKTQRDHERDRADQNKAWAERAELRLSKDTESYMRQLRELRDSLEARDRLLESATRDLNNVVRQRDQLMSEMHGVEGLHAKLAESARDRDRLTAQIGKVSSAVHSPEILLALEYDRDNWDEEQYGAVTTAIRNVRQAIGSPGPETSPA